MDESWDISSGGFKKLALAHGDDGISQFTAAGLRIAAALDSGARQR